MVVMMEVKFLLSLGLVTTLLCAITLNLLTGDLDSNNISSPSHYNHVDEPNSFQRKSILKLGQLRRNNVSNTNIIKSVDKIDYPYNDDYCDFKDGSDEYKTSACSHILVNQALFECSYDKSIKIFTSRVMDGVFDCLDKSDEDILNSTVHKIH